MKQSVRPSQQGSALVFALIAVTVVASAGAAFLQLTTSMSKTQTASVQNSQAFYLAEAGLAEAFQGVRLGRTGTLGSATAPARYGDGLLWVEAVETADGQVRLTSTALAGRGRASLSYVLQPTDSNLGIFSTEEMVIDDVILVDGFNSERGSYDAHIPKNMALPDPVPAKAEQYLSALSSQGHPVGCHMGYHNWCTGTHAHDVAFAQESADLSAPSGGTWQRLMDSDDYDDDDEYSFVPSSKPSFEDRNVGMEYEISLWRTELEKTYNEARVAAQATGNEIPMLPPVGRHTGKDGILGSNQSVTLNLDFKEIPEIYGDIQSTLKLGLDGGGSAGATISGRVSGAPQQVELPEVQIPALTSEEVVTYGDLLPMTIPSGTAAYQSLTIQKDAEVIIRGPATVVLGQFTLEDGATLTLDTRAGEIAMYVTEGMDMQPGSATITTGDQTNNMSLQVGAIETLEGGPAPIRLDSASQFHGTIYAPQTEVYVGSDFEIYGRVIARKLEFGPGAKLHVDHAGTQGSSIPEIVSWKIVEIPSQVKVPGSNPFTILGVSPDSTVPLTESHDLASVTIDLEYFDQAGNLQTYTGLEAGFDWDNVRSVAHVERIPSRTRTGTYSTGSVGGTSTGTSTEPEDTPSEGASAEDDDGADDEPEADDGADDDEPTTVRKVVNDNVEGALRFGVEGLGGWMFTGIMEFNAPFNADEWARIAEIRPALDPTLYNKIITAHNDKGGDPSFVQ